MKKAMFKIFQEEILFWQKKFQISEWEIYLSYKNLNNCRAEILFNWEGMIAHITLNKAWTKKEKIEVQKTAFHEVCHILLAPLRSYNYHKDQEELEHAIIRRLENTIFVDYLKDEKLK